MLLQVHELDVVLAVKELLRAIPASRFVDLVAAFGQSGIAHFFGQLFAGPQSPQVEDSDHRIGAVEVDVVRVVLLSLDHTVIVRVLLEEELQCFANLRPVAFQECVIRTGLVFAVGLENIAGLRIAAPEIGPITAESNHAGIGHQAGLRIEVLHFAHRAFQLWKQPRQGVFVIPHVSARAVAAPHSFIGPEATVLPDFARGGGERGDGGMQSVQQPVRERPIVVGPHPQRRVVRQPIDMRADILQPRRPRRRIARHSNARSALDSENATPPQTASSRRHRGPGETTVPQRRADVSRTAQYRRRRWPDAVPRTGTPAARRSAESNWPAPSRAAPGPRCSTSRNRAVLRAGHSSAVRARSVNSI